MLLPLQLNNLLGQTAFVTVPDVRGLTLQEAIDRLAAASLVGQSA